MSIADGLHSMRAPVEERAASLDAALAAQRPSLPTRIVTLVRRDVPLALLDLGIVVGGYVLALTLRLEGDISTDLWAAFWRFMIAAAVLHLLVNYLFGLYGQMWRFASVQEARRVVLAGLVSLGLVAGANAWFGAPLPWSVAIAGPGLAFIGFGAVRFQSRLFAFRRYQADPTAARRVLIVGAGEAGAMILNDILRHPESGLRPVAFVDDDPRRRGRSLHGVAVLGDRTTIPSLVHRLQVDQVLLAIPTATSELVREVAAMCEAAEVSLRVLPSLHEVVGGRVTVRDLRDLNIEDLLGRQQIETDLVAVRSLLRDRRVLITGAGGSIGSEIARQVAACEPAGLLLLDSDETHLHDLVVTLPPDTPSTALLGDVRDRARLVDLFVEHAPQVVFHAAAHKHVPMLEGNPREALTTNVLGTANVADAAVTCGVERFVLISTDKAVHPTSVMGGSKRIAETIVRSLDGRGTRFCAVRFGNVLGSRGSVIPTFLRQIQAGGPVTVTDPAMTRYFMSVHEAVQLVLQAAAMSERGGEIFTLEMGEPVNILDLARNLIRLSGRVPGKDVEIEILGARPGEKLHEELVNHDEVPEPTRHPGIVVATPPPPDRGDLRRLLRELEDLAAAGSTDDLAARIRGADVPATTLVEIAT